MSTPRSSAGAERPESHQQHDGRRLAGRNLERMRARTRRIRRNVAVLALALFLATFAGIYLQMASGHDPVLSRHTTLARANAAASDGSQAASSSSSQSTSSESTGAASSVTTSQS